MSKRKEYELSEAELAKRAGQFPKARPIYERYKQIEAKKGCPKAYYNPGTDTYRVIDEFACLGNYTERSFDRR